MKILIFSASTGGGHRRASNALKSYFESVDSSCNVKIIDGLQCINPMLNKTIVDGYEYIAKKIPKVFGTLYKSTNNDTRMKTLLSAIMTNESKHLLPLIEEFDPDIIISTHPFVTEMVSMLKDKQGWKVPLMCVITDYGPHMAWINKNVDSYIVAGNEMAEMMYEIGVDKEKVHPFGIPVDLSFFSHIDKEKVLQELDLYKDKITVLVMAGSFGVNNILKIYNNMVNIDLDFQIIVITGKNQKLYDSFEKRLNYKPDRPKKIKKSRKDKIKMKKNKPQSKKKKKIHLKRHYFSNSKPTKLLFFTNEVQKYMQVSDLIITKPGGLTVSESLACNLPMVIFDAIPGQEEDNAEFLVNNNMAVKLEKTKDSADTIRKVLKDRQKLESMRKACENFDTSKSMENIYKEVKRLTNGD